MVDPTFNPDQAAGSSEQPAEPPEAEPPRAEHPRAAPVGDGDYVVRSGDSIESVAWRQGVDPRDVWEHPGNAAIREKRSDRVLLPGDRLALPRAADRPSFAVSPGGSKSLKATIPKLEVRMRLLHGDEPRANMPYTAMVDGVRTEGQTDGDGNVVLKVRPGTRRASLTLHEEGEDYSFDDHLQLDLGGLNPTTSISGVQARLRNLGYCPGLVDGDDGPRTRAALEDFQRRNGLEVTGEADEATMNALRDHHGT